MRFPWSRRSRPVQPTRPAPTSFGARVAQTPALVHTEDHHRHGMSDAAFAQLVQAAIDELPEEFSSTLTHVPVMIGDSGDAVGAYGLYHGLGIAHPEVPAQIIIFRDTLLRDFGYDHHQLAEQVRRVVRHELGHHLGFDENGVRRLGL